MNDDDALSCSSDRKLRDVNITILGKIIINKSSCLSICSSLDNYGVNHGDVAKFLCSICRGTGF